MDTSSVKQSDSPSTLDKYWEELNQTNTDNSTNLQPMFPHKIFVGRFRCVQIFL